MTRTTIRIPEDVYNEIWKLHSDTRQSVNATIVKLIKYGLDTVGRPLGK